MSEWVGTSAVEYLAETDALEMQSLKRAVWEDLRSEVTSEGLVAVSNHSYQNPAEHTHVVGAGPEHAMVYHCSCPDYTYRDTICKHMIHVAMRIDEGELTAADLQAPDAQDAVEA